MRVISGIKRGTVLFAPKSLDTRPTTDRVKENIFNLIAFDICDKFVLDLFSGSGAMGIEALSRGAKKCTFVDSSKDSCEIIKKNLEKTALFKDSALIQKSFDIFLNEAKEKYSLVFLDPPYHKGYIDKALEIMVSKNLLCDNALIVCECDSDEEIKDVKSLSRIKEKVYGRVKITILRKES